MSVSDLDAKTDAGGAASTGKAQRRMPLLMRARLTRKLEMDARAIYEQSDEWEDRATWLAARRLMRLALHIGRG